MRALRTACAPFLVTQGLGKTVQVIALLCHLVEHENLARGPFMIVVPASVLPNWASELARWAPQLEVAAYTGPEAARSAVYAQKLARGRFQASCMPRVASAPPA